MELDALRAELDQQWASREYAALAGRVAELQALAAGTADAGERARLADLMRRYVTPERLDLLMLDFIGGAVAADVAMRFWNFTPDEIVWPVLLETWSRLPEGEARAFVFDALRERVVMNTDLLRQTLVSSEPQRVRAAVALRETIGSHIAAIRE